MTAAFLLEFFGPHRTKKKLNSMTKAEQYAYKWISRFWVHEHPGDKASLYDWKERSYRLVATSAYEMALKINLSAEQTHEEVANVIETFIKLKEGTERENYEKK